MPHLDARVFACSPLNAGAHSPLEDGVGVIIVTGHVIRLHQLLVAEEGVLTKGEYKLEALQTREQHLSACNVTQRVVLAIAQRSNDPLTGLHQLHTAEERCCLKVSTGLKPYRPQSSLSVHTVHHKDLLSQMHGCCCNCMAVVAIAWRSNDPITRFHQLHTAEERYCLKVRAARNPAEQRTKI